MGSCPSDVHIHKKHTATQDFSSARRVQSYGERVPSIGRSLCRRGGRQAANQPPPLQANNPPFALLGCGVCICLLHSEEVSSRKASALFLAVFLCRVCCGRSCAPAATGRSSRPARCLFSRPGPFPLVSHAAPPTAAPAPAKVAAATTEPPPAGGCDADYQVLTAHLERSVDTASACSCSQQFHNTYYTGKALLSRRRGRSHRGRGRGRSRSRGRSSSSSSSAAAAGAAAAAAAAAQ